MNLHRIVASAIGSVNPFIDCDYYASSGFTTEGTGKRVPSYASPVTATAQVQPLSFKDLTQIDGLNLGGIQKAIYLYGSAFAVVRAYVKGGDKIVIAAGSNAGTFLVNLVSEQWDDGAAGAAWVRCVVTLQND